MDCVIRDDQHIFDMLLVHYYMMVFLFHYCASLLHSNHQLYISGIITCTSVSPHATSLEEDLSFYLHSFYFHSTQEHLFYFSSKHNSGVKF